MLNGCLNLVGRCEKGSLLRKGHKVLIVGAFSGQCEILQSPGDTSTTKETPVQD